MTNREWLLNKMQNMSDEEFATKLEDFCRDNEYICKIMDKECEDTGDCTYCVKCWLQMEHKEKITLSEAERIILENIDKEYKWIARDELNNILWIFAEKPTKNNGWWINESNSKIGVNLALFNHLFQFITWNDSEPYNIEELLKCGD